MTCLQNKSGMANLNCIKEILVPKREPYISFPFKERTKFYEAKKLQSESVNDYYAKLVNLSKSCEFNENFDDRVLCDKFITGFASGFIFEQLCNQNKDITFSEALNLALKCESDLYNSSEEIDSAFDRHRDSTINKLNVLEEEALDIKPDPLDYLEVPVPVSDVPQHPIDSGDTYFICYLCNESFENEIQCHLHIAKHDFAFHSDNGTKSKKYFCEICGKTCDRRHSLIHSDLKRYKCPTCGRAFNSSANCRAHVESHNSDNAFKCSICHRQFKQKRHLKRHLDVHFGEKRFKCNFCSQLFRLKATLNNHIRLHETSKLNCDHCKLAFRDHSKFDDHIQKHVNVKKQCDICGKKVKYMKAHMDHHNSPRSHNCTFCDKKFIRRQELIAHEKLHTGLDCFACHICDKKFNRANSLKAHLIRHTSKNYICNICGKRNDELGRHILTHSDAKDYQCDFCDTLFTCHRSKLRHMKNKHPQGK